MLARKESWLKLPLGTELGSEGQDVPGVRDEA